MNILLAISGSIAAYKTPDLARGLINQGHQVVVVLSKGAEEFVNPKVFKYLGVKACYRAQDDFKTKGVLHIQLSKWLDTFVLAPASANTLSSLAQGEAKDLLQSIFLSLEDHKNKLLVPAMNPNMLQNPITQKNLNALEHVGAQIINPDSGILACGDEGHGKFPDVRELVELIPLFTRQEINQKVLITAGATLSAVDKVRYLTNPARGGSAYLLAKKFLAAGYRVEVLRGKYIIPEFKYLLKHPRYKEKLTITTPDLLKQVKQASYDVYISPMAVSDLMFDYSDKKIKKSQMNGQLKFTIAPDVLQWVVDNRKRHHTIIGFAAEADLSAKVIKEKMRRKPVDLLVATLVDGGLKEGNPQLGFGTEDGEYKLVRGEKSYHFARLHKAQLADLIVSFVQTKKILKL